MTENCLTQGEKALLEAKITYLSDQLTTARTSKTWSLSGPSAKIRTLFTEGLTKPNEFLAKALAGAKQLRELATGNTPQTEKIRGMNNILTKLAYDRLELQNLLVKTTYNSLADSFQTTRLKEALTQIYKEINTLYLRIITDGQKYILEFKTGKKLL